MPETPDTTTGDIGAVGARRRVVYVTYDGLEDQLGQSQVRPYLERLAGCGHQFEVISFEKPGVPLRVRERLGRGIRWTALRYHRTPTVPATAFDMSCGLAAVSIAGLVSGADIVHVRSYVAATLVLPWLVASRAPLLFDMRGLWPDEKVDGGAWPREGRMYRGAKTVERVLLRNADAITVLTHAAQRYLRQEYTHRSEIRAPIRVIPTCANLDRFAPGIEPDPALSRQLAGARVLGYVGSLETWYMADAMARFYLAWREAVRRQDGESRATKFLIISHSRPDAIASVLRTENADGDVVSHAASYGHVPAALRCAEAGICLRLPSFSSQAGSPTKIGEMLACGLPVVANAIGDVPEVLGESPAGVLLRDTRPEDFAHAAAAIVSAVRRPDIRRESRQIAERWFSLDEGAAAYDRLYRGMPVSRGQRPPMDDATWPDGPS